MPLSDAVASIVPVELMASAATGALCAWTTFKAVRLSVSNNSTSPVVGAGGAGGAGEEVRGEAEEGAGEGYARKEFSEEGESAHMAKRQSQYIAA